MYLAAAEGGVAGNSGQQVSFPRRPEQSAALQTQWRCHFALPVPAENCSRYMVLSKLAACAVLGVGSRPGSVGKSLRAAAGELAMESGARGELGR